MAFRALRLSSQYALPLTTIASKLRSCRGSYTLRQERPVCWGSAQGPAQDLADGGLG